MKYMFVLRRNAKSCLSALIAIASVSTSSHLLADDISKSQILQSKADQEDIRDHTTAVITEVQGLIDELAANGISGEDTKVLLATKAALNNLSGPEMDQVIASLQKAGEATDTKTTQQDALTAYSAQKGIITQFQNILKEYAQRQAAYELPLKFKELSDRQTETMRTTTEVATRTLGQSSSELSSVDQTTEQIVQSDQASIATEVAQAQQQLDKAVQDNTGDEGKNLVQAQADMKTGKLQQALNSAADDIKSGDLLKAIGDQKLARDELRNVTRDLNPPADAVDALTALAGDLGQIITGQKKLLTQTNTSITTKVMDGSLSDSQVVLVDKADLLQQDMLSLSPDAATLVKASINPMQVSRGFLHDLGGFSQATQPQQDAISKLEDAQKRLQQEVADAQKAEDEANKDPVAKLQDMQKKIQDAMKQQQQIAQQTTQAETAPTPDANSLADAQQKQDQLQQQTAAMQQDSQALSLAASQALANAAAQMDQAQKNLTDPTKATTAEQDQTAAMAALDQANKQLDQQIAQDEKQDPTDSQLDAAASALQKTQDDVTSAQSDTTPPASSTPSATPPDTAAAASALADAAQDAQSAAAAPGLPTDAAQDVQNAQAAIAQGEKAAGQKDAAGAAAAAAAAQAALAQAQSSVASAKSAMAAANSPSSGPPTPSNQPGPPGPPGPPGRLAGMQAGHSTKIMGGNNGKGTMHGVSGSDKFISLAARERAAVGESQEEKRPQEYAPMIDQYMKNLADQASEQ